MVSSVLIMRTYELHETLARLTRDRSSKSALHGLIHWLSKIYCKKGITVNGIAPALIDDTAMLPGTAESLANGKFDCINRDS